MVDERSRMNNRSNDDNSPSRRSGGRLNLNRRLRERQGALRQDSGNASDESHRRPARGSGSSDNRRRLRSRTARSGPPSILPPDFEERVIKIARVVKVVKGGRRFSFSAYVVVGNRRGRIGLGHGKANEVQDAIKKATKDALKNAVSVVITNTSVPHESYTKFLATRILIKPAPQGRGLVAAGVARTIVELAGYVNISTKIYGSRTAQNVALGMIRALVQMNTAEQLRELRHGDNSAVSRIHGGQ